MCEEVFQWVGGCGVRVLNGCEWDTGGGVAHNLIFEMNMIFIYTYLYMYICLKFSTTPRTQTWHLHLFNMPLPCANAPHIDSTGSGARWNNVRPASLSDGVGVCVCVCALPWRWYRNVGRKGVELFWKFKIINMRKMCVYTHKSSTASGVASWDAPGDYGGMLNI